MDAAGRQRRRRPTGWRPGDRSRLPVDASRGGGEGIGVDAPGDDAVRGDAEVRLVHLEGEAEAPPKAISHLRALLVVAGVLPERDEHLASLERWCTAAIARIRDPVNQRLIRSFVTWHHLARLRRRLGDKPASYAQVNRIRRNVIRAIEFLDWLADQGLTLRTCRQQDADRWLQDPSTLRHEVRDLVRWARRNGHAGDIEIPAYKERVHVPPVDADMRLALAALNRHCGCVGCAAAPLATTPEIPDASRR